MTCFKAGNKAFALVLLHFPSYFLSSWGSWFYVLACLSQGLSVSQRFSMLPHCSRAQCSASVQSLFLSPLSLLFSSLSPMPGRGAVLLNYEEHFLWSWYLIPNWPIDLLQSQDLCLQMPASTVSELKGLHWHCWFAWTPVCSLFTVLIQPGTPRK